MVDWAGSKTLETNAIPILVNGRVTGECNAVLALSPRMALKQLITLLDTYAANRPTSLVR
eukprot:4863948-Lingulodinium_polyedra.AAC.1